MKTTECETTKVSNTYEVLRKGKRIGSHVICFNEEENELRVSAETNMKVKFLFFTAYKYQYTSHEVWAGGVLQTVSTRVDDNGKKVATDAVRRQTSGAVQVQEGVSQIAFDFFTTNHWNIAAVQQEKLFNTITGKLNDVSFTESDRNDKYIEYAVEGELNITTRYDLKGNWLGMNFLHTDGSEIEFRCVECSNTPQVKPS